MLQKFRGRLGMLPWLWNHPANDGNRFAAVGRALAFQFRGRVLRRETVALVGRSSRFVADIGAAAASKAVYANPPDWAEMMVWRQRLRTGDLFVDVGANIGTYSLWAGDCGADVIAVEPGPGTVKRLRRNLAMNGFCFEIVEAVVTDSTGTAQFDPSGDSTARLGEGIEVAAVTLDAVLGDRTAAGVKVDVEGFELLVLRGATRALADKRIACIQLEWNDLSRSALGVDRRPIEDLLRAAGYFLARPDASGNLTKIENPAPGSDVFALPLRGYTDPGDVVAPEQTPV